VSRYVEVPIASGGSVTIEVEDVGGGRTMRGGGDTAELIERSRQTLEESLGGISAALRDIVAELHSAEVSAIDVELGLKLSGEAGFVVAKAGAEANFRVLVHWERPKTGDAGP
jgi:NTP-dependent ternary system trypsin peptidase co-occuring protein